MRIYGIDFSSDPKEGKPLTKAVCHLDGNALTVEALEEIRTYQALTLFLSAPGEWVAGIDFPFGQPRRLITDLKWPLTWADYVRLVANITKPKYANLIDGYRAGQPAGSKEHFRVVDRKAKSLSPMKMYGVPVGKMFHQGAPFLLASPCRVVPFDAVERTTVVVEAYPGLVARKFIGKRSYKNDNTKKQTADHGEARKALVAGITATKMTGSKSMSEWYGFSVGLAGGLSDQCANDPSGDKVDAVLAAIQAAWAYTRREDNFGVPGECVLLEGWIPDPETAMGPQGESPHR